MGAWGTSLYANDTTSDIKDFYMSLLRNETSNNNSYEHRKERDLLPSIYVELSPSEILRTLYMQRNRLGFDISQFSGLLSNLSYGDSIFIRDVTNEVNAPLRYISAYAQNRGNTINLVPDLLWFYNQVNHSRDWDIKRPNPWENTIRTEFPGSFSTPVFFRGNLVTLEYLGNFTYGYIGAALGLSLNTLFYGSAFAHLTSHINHNGLFRGSISGLQDLDNELGDWIPIFRGFNAFSNRECD